MSQVRQSVDQMAARAQTAEDLAACLRVLQKRARSIDEGRATYRQLAKATGYSHSIIGAYLTGKVVPPSTRLDELAQLLGATPSELRELASARDRVEDGHREQRTSRQTLPLPPSRVRLIGREEQLAALDEILAPGGNHVRTGLATVLGPPGVGKTSLTIEWARRHADDFDHVHYLDLCGLREDVAPVETAEALRRLLLSAGVSAQAIPADERARADLLARTLAGSRVLLVLDDVLDADQVRPMLVADCAVIVISKILQYVLIAADGAVPVTLSALSPEASRALLRDRVGADLDRVGADELDAVLTACAGWPIALSLVAARARTLPTTPFSIAGLFTGAQDARANLMILMKQSFDRLPARATAGVSALIAHPGGIITAAQLACLGRLTLNESTDLLADYATIFALLDVDGGWLLHPLVREFLLRLPGIPRDLAADERLVQHLAASAFAAATLIDPGTRLTPPEVPAETVCEQFPDERAAADWARTFDPWLLRQQAAGGELSGWFAQARAEMNRLAPTIGAPGRRQLANLTVSSWAPAV